MELQLSIQNSQVDGIALCAIPGESFNCVEYKTKAESPITILCAPWIQFEPTELADWRLRMATEVMRRAMAYDSLIASGQQAQRARDSWIEGHDRLGQRNEQLATMLRELVETRDNRCYIKLDKGTDVTDLLTYWGNAAK